MLLRVMSRATSRPWLPSMSKSDNRAPQGFGAAIESPGQSATACGPLVNSPGPSPWPPQVAECEPSGLKTLISLLPELAITIRPSASRMASVTRNSSSASPLSTAPIVRDGCALNSHGSRESGAGGSFSTMVMPALSWTTTGSRLSAVWPVSSHPTLQRVRTRIVVVRNTLVVDWFIPPRSRYFTLLPPGWIPGRLVFGDHSGAWWPGERRG